MNIGLSTYDTYVFQYLPTNVRLNGLDSTLHKAEFGRSKHKESCVRADFPQNKLHQAVDYTTGSDTATIRGLLCFSRSSKPKVGTPRLIFRLVISRCLYVTV